MCNLKEAQKQEKVRFEESPKIGEKKIQNVSIETGGRGEKVNFQKHVEKGQKKALQKTEKKVQILQTDCGAEIGQKVEHEKIESQIQKGHEKPKKIQAGVDQE